MGLFGTASHIFRAGLFGTALYLCCGGVALADGPTFDCGWPTGAVRLHLVDGASLTAAVNGSAPARVAITGLVQTRTMRFVDFELGGAAWHLVGSVDGSATLQRANVAETGKAGMWQCEAAR